jgi:hypothetical protein
MNVTLCFCERGKHELSYGRSNIFKGRKIMEIKINEAEWKNLSKDEQSKLTNIVSGYFKEAKLVPDASAPASPNVAQAQLGNPFCEIACGVAEAAAVAACAGLPGPAAAVCIAAAHAAGDACRKNC